jgi:hypothetical protein
VGKFLDTGNPRSDVGGVEFGDATEAAARSAFFASTCASIVSPPDETFRGGNSASRYRSGLEDFDGSDAAPYPEDVPKTLGKSSESLLRCGRGGGAPAARGEGLGRGTGVGLSRALPDATAKYGPCFRADSVVAPASCGAGGRGPPTGCESRFVSLVSRPTPSARA